MAYPSGMSRLPGGILTVVTPTISPYRIPVFNAVAAELGSGFHVIFIVESTARRAWPIYRSEIGFSYEVLRGIAPLVGPRQRPVYLTTPAIYSLLRRRPKHVLVGGWDHAEFVWSWIAARLTGATFSIWSESVLLGTSPIRALVKRRAVGLADYYLVPGQAAASNLVALGASPERIYYAPNAVDVRFYRSASRRERVHLLVVSRLIRAKGVDIALRAVAQLCDPPRLLVVGNGPEKSALELLAADLGIDAVFLGHLDRDDLRELYSGALALLFPTLADPWGLVVNEALASGCPVIVSSVAGCAYSLVKPGLNGEIVPPRDPDMMARAISRVIAPADRADYFRGAWETGARHTPERCAAGFLQLADE